MKEYRNMEDAARIEWLLRFGEFIANDYATLKAMGDGWRDAFERGLSLFGVFSMTEKFVSESRRHHDYERRVKRMCFFVEELRHQVISVEGDVLARVSGPQYKRRVGRPTAASMYAEREALARQESDFKKFGALSAISGQNVEVAKSKPLSSLKVEKKLKMQGPDLFATADKNEPRNNGITGLRDNEPTRLRADDGDTSAPTLHLQEVKHFLSSELQERIESVAQLRGRAATESEMAKTLAMSHGSKEEIREHAQAAAACTEAYTKIYEDVDQSLALLYIRTRLDSAAVVRGETRDSQLSKTLPYYEKAVAADPGFEGKALLALQKQTESEVLSPDGRPMSKADKAALLHKYRSFFMRKNVKITKDRLKKMEEIISYLRSINEPCDEYEHIFEESKKKNG